MGVTRINCQSTAEGNSIAVANTIFCIHVLLSSITVFVTILKDHWLARFKNRFTRHIHVNQREGPRKAL